MKESSPGKSRSEKSWVNVYNHLLSYALCFPGGECPQNRYFKEQLSLVDCSRSVPVRNVLKFLPFSLKFYIAFIASYYIKRQLWQVLKVHVLTTPRTDTRHTWSEHDNPEIIIINFTYIHVLLLSSPISFIVHLRCRRRFPCNFSIYIVLLGECIKEFRESKLVKLTKITRDYLMLHTGRERCY